MTLTEEQRALLQQFVQWMNTSDNSSYRPIDAIYWDETCDETITVSIEDAVELVQTFEKETHAD